MFTCGFMSGSRHADSARKTISLRKPTENFILCSSAVWKVQWGDKEDKTRLMEKADVWVFPDTLDQLKDETSALLAVKQREGSFVPLSGSVL